MPIRKTVFAVAVLLGTSNAPAIDEDIRQMVELPEMMQQHMLSNMRDHLATINEILLKIASGELEQATTTGIPSLRKKTASWLRTTPPRS